uniref:Uncharacterized protein n=1 Tax=Trichogramma kaykai TaxID=54128 RepID=A0ABD2WG85_9HYME
MKREKSARHRRTGKIGQKFRTGICSVKPMQRKKREMAIENLQVDTNGQIMTPERRKSFPEAVLSEKRKHALSEKGQSKLLQNVQKERERKIASEASIFSEESAEESHDLTDTIRMRMRD